MKRVYVNEEWCLGCHLCEYNCAFANSGMTDMATARKGKPIFPRITLREMIKYLMRYPAVTVPTLSVSKAALPVQSQKQMA